MVVPEAAGVRRIALTGGIATGKSHVRARFEKLGVPTIDADTIARDVVAPGTPGFLAVVERFGPTIVGPDGSVDRRALAAIVFGDAAARADLEAIIHPSVRAAIDDWFASLDPSRHPFAVADIPLLFETGRERDLDAVVVTTCSPATQWQRVLSRDGMTEQEARQRIAAQLPAAHKLARADFVIDTDGPFERTDAQVDDLVSSWRRTTSPVRP